MTPDTNKLPADWYQPPAEFSPAPFWFWNDDLQDAELIRQLDEFQAHGIDAFVIHPRVGLPRHLGWMSRALLDKMRFIIDEAAKRGMWVILYDEGMYPSGSASGLVVAENPRYQCRGMVRINLDTVQPNTVEQGVQIDANGQVVLTNNQTLLTEATYQGQRYAIVERPIDSVIRGLHFIHEDADEPPEDNPPATDLLNPDAVACFIRLTYDRFYEEFGDHFGTTIPAIFTDEPMLLGRPRERDLLPATTDILTHINAFLGYDFAPHLPALWDDNAPDKIHQDFMHAIEHRMEETYYAQLYNWCSEHNIALTGHPAEPDATRHLRYFHIPGQDIVWRYLEPDTPSALESRQSTQGKAATSMMLHTGRRRNANEFCGAYGHDLTFDEMCWLANWLLIRGCNLLIPHAFYYSVRGPRKHERPPDVGLHSTWWNDDFTAVAKAWRRLSWLNTDSEAICEIAIVGEHHRLPIRAAKVCFENQLDFHYLDVDDLLHHATPTTDGLTIEDQTYRVLIVDSTLPDAAQTMLKKLPPSVTVIYWTDDAPQSLTQLQQHAKPALALGSSPDGLRLRHVRKAGFTWYLLFNETATPVDLTIKLNPSQIWQIIDPVTDTASSFDGQLHLDGHDLRILVHKAEV